MLRRGYYERGETAGHRNGNRFARTTNLLERLRGEERRWIKTIPHVFGERAVLESMFAALARASRFWRRLVINEFKLKQLKKLKAELHIELGQRTASAALLTISPPPLFLQQQLRFDLANSYKQHFNFTLMDWILNFFVAKNR
ncbi:MAG: hypothetical protein RKO66_10815 [Candidatus Contendobacter sp.]|nr:hypothetical protein [Candidatus Contendobacter sp.]MDS4058745.1 hypothetical protein [Candidatus Contendobacter sp.]